MRRGVGIVAPLVILGEIGIGVGAYRAGERNHPFEPDRRPLGRV